MLVRTCIFDNIFKLHHPVPALHGLECQTREWFVYVGSSRANRMCVAMSSHHTGMVHAIQSPVPCAQTGAFSALLCNFYLAGKGDSQQGNKSLHSGRRN